MSKLDDADHRWRNMCEMLDRLGLDPAALEHGRLSSDLRAAVTTCQNCSVDQPCQEWLLRAPEELVHAPDFCPNAGLFAIVRSLIEQSGDKSD